MKCGYLISNVAIALVLQIIICKSQMQYEICEYWVGQKVNFKGISILKIDITFKNKCGGIRNLQHWNFTVDIQPVTNVEKFELECDCVKQNCSKEFGNVTISKNKLYLFKFIPKCFMTACLVCPSRGVRLYRRVPIELKLSTPIPMASFTEAATESRDKMLPISIGCLGSLTLLFVFLSLLFLHRYHRQRCNKFYVTINSPDKCIGVQTENSGTKSPANKRKSKVIVISYPSNQSSKFLEILRLFSEHFETFHMLDCAYDLTQNFYDWAEKVPTSYDFLLVVLDEKLLEQNCKSDSYRFKEVLGCFKSSISPEKSCEINVFVITFGHQEDLVTKAISSYLYLRTGFVFSISDEELNSDITKNSSLVELLSHLCSSTSQTLNEKREYIREKITS